MGRRLRDRATVMWKGPAWSIGRGLAFWGGFAAFQAIEGCCPAVEGIALPGDLAESPLTGRSSTGAAMRLESISSVAP